MSTYYTPIIEGVQVAVGKIGSATLHTYSIIEGVRAAVRTKSGLQYYTPVIEGVQAAVGNQVYILHTNSRGCAGSRHEGCFSNI